MKYRALLIFFSQACLVVVTYYASFLLRLDANLDPAMRERVLADPARWFCWSSWCFPIASVCSTDGGAMSA